MQMQVMVSEYKCFLSQNWVWFSVYFSTNNDYIYIRKQNNKNKVYVI